MTVLRSYMNQAVSYRSLVTKDGWDGNTYDPPENEDALTIMALYEPDYSERLGRSGASTQYDGRVVSTVEFALGDLVEGHELKRVVPVVGLDGATGEEWEAFF